MILVNGVESDQINLIDRGLQYGDGLFETIAVVDRRPELWGRHMARLQQGCLRLRIPAPDEGLLLAEAAQLIATRSAERSVLKIIVTRGAGGRGYRPPEHPKPTRILSLTPWPDYPAENRTAGTRLHLCETRLGSNPALAGIKHLNRLEQVLARSEWSDPEIAEGAMMDGEGCLIEGTMSNLFFVRRGEVITPDLSQCGVAGVMRGALIEHLRSEGVPVTIRPIALSELDEMEEAFCSNSLIGLWPIRQLGEQGFSAPGKMATRLTNLSGFGKYC